jgi:hypothetical protein
MRMRTLAFSGLFSLVLVVSGGCEKGGGTSNPEPADALSDVDDGKTRLKYLESGFSLESTIEQDFTVSGGAAGHRVLKASGTIVATATSDGNLRVELTNSEEIELLEEGAMKPEVEDGEEPVDNLAKLKGAKSWYVMDRIGEADTDASKALPENVERKKQRDAAKEASEDGNDMALRSLEVGSSLGLPPLPTTGLVEGESTKLPTKQETMETAGGDIDVEIDQIYMLTAIEEVDGRKLATVDIETIASGAAELNFGQGAQFIAFDSEETGTLVFDMNAGVPVNWEGERLTEFHVGEKTFEQVEETRSTFAIAGSQAPAAAAESEAAPAEAASAEATAAPAEGDAATENGEAAKPAE